MVAIPTGRITAKPAKRKVDLSRIVIRSSRDRLLNHLEIKMSAAAMAVRLGEAETCPRNLLFFLSGFLRLQ
jgi:hypothetical protein